MPEKERSPELMLGTLALKAGYITRKQLDECLREQQTARGRGQVLPLGQLLVRKRYLKERSLIFLLQNHEYVDQRSDDKLFGQIAVANGLLSQKALFDCLDRQRNMYFDQRRVKRIGELLLSEKLLTAQEVEAVKTAQERMRAQMAPSGGDSTGRTTAIRPAASGSSPKIEWEETLVELPEIAPLPPAPTAQRTPPATKRTRPAPTKLRRDMGGTTRRKR